MRSFGGWLIVAFVVGMAVSPAGAAEAGKLLPSDTKVIVTVDVRQVLSDHRNTDFVQRYLDQWRLALKGDGTQLRKYYEQRQLHKYEGISCGEFLARCKIIKNISDALGVDPLEDIEHVTFGLTYGGPRSFVIIVEGRFKPETFKAAIEQIAKEYFGSFKVDPGGNVWQIADDSGLMRVSLLKSRALAITNDKNTMDALRAASEGKKQGGLAKGMRAQLDSVQREHVGVVVADVDLLLNYLARLLRDTVTKTPLVDDPAGKFMVTQGTDWIQNLANDVSSAGLGLSVREDDLRLLLSVDTKKPALAKEWYTLIERGNFWGAIALKALVNNEPAQQLADILSRQRITLKEMTVTTQTEIPYDFIKLVAGPWLKLLSKDFAPAAAPGPLVQTALDALSARITSIPLWTLPPRDKDETGNFEVREIRNVAYRDGLSDPNRHRLDMFLPRNKKDFPVVVLVHGGSWILGDNRSAGLYSSVGQFLASQGIGVVLPNYRLYPRVKHPEHIKDVARAVAWTHAGIGKYGGDARRLFLTGHSAGAHLVTLLATDETYLRSEGLKIAAIKGVIAVSGVYKVPPGVMHFSLGGSGPRALRIEHMLPVRGDSNASFKYELPGLPAQLDMFAPIFGDTADACAAASPMTHIRKDLPPFLLLVAERDLPTILEMTSEFQQALKRAGCDARLLKLPKRNHNSLMFSVISPNDSAARVMMEFIRK